MADLDTLYALAAGTDTPAVHAATVDLLATTPDLTAVWHPAGWACVPLLRPAREGAYRKLCVHVSDPTMTVGGPVHRHSWRAKVHILAGTVANLTYEVYDGTDHEVTEARSLGQADTLTPTGRLVGYRATGHAEVAAGQHYTVPVTDWHGTQRHGFTVTVVAGTGDGGADQFLATPGQQPRVHTRRTLTGDEVRQLVKRTLRELGAQEGTTDG